MLAAHEPNLIQALADDVYTINQSKLVKCEMKPQAKYIICVQAHERMNADANMQETKRGYSLFVDEADLYHEIGRLQKEGCI